MRLQAKRLLKAFVDHSPNKEQLPRFLSQTLKKEIQELPSFEHLDLRQLFFHVAMDAENALLVV